MQRVLALILGGGTGNRLSLLSQERAKPAVPFGGKYRVIDFSLSNCVNSGIYNVAVLTQYNPRSLTEHIGVGQPWGLDRTPSGVRLLQPFLSRGGGDWYRDTGDAIYQNLSFVDSQRVDQVLILAGDHIYTMRYDLMINFHRQRNADMTLGVVEVAPSDLNRFGVVTLDHMQRVKQFQEKPNVAETNLGSMGIYIFNKETLLQVIDAMGGKEEGSDFGHDIIPGVLRKYKVYGYKFSGYWRDVGTIEAYWKANMELIEDLPPLNLYDPELTVLTRYQTMAPVKIGPQASITRSLLCHGGIVNGHVNNSVLSPEVYIEEGARVVDSIVLNDTVIGRDAVVDRCVIDKSCWIGPGCHIGYGSDFTPNQEEPELLNTGITLVGKGARLREAVKVGRNCKIGCWVEETDFDSDWVPSGATVDRKTPQRFRA